MICVNCGKNIPDNVKFCGSCGYQAPSPIQGAQINQVPPQNAQMRQAPPPQMRQAPPPQMRQAPPPQMQQPQYQAPQRPPYQAYNSPSPHSQSDGSVMSMGSYLVTFIIACIPIIGFIMLLVWSFGSSTNENKKNLSKAILCLMIITGILYFIFGSVLISRVTRMMY